MPRVNRTIEDVCQKDETSDEGVLGTIERWLTPDLAWEALPPFTGRGLDEMALQQGDRDAVVLVTARLATGRLMVLAVLPERPTATLVTGVATIPGRRRGQLQTVCTERWDAYVTAVRAVRPPATLVSDRCPVARHDRAGADT
jgi:transposase